MSSPFEDRDVELRKLQEILGGGIEPADGASGIAEGLIRFSQIIHFFSTGFINGLIWKGNVDDSDGLCLVDTRLMILLVLDGDLVLFVVTGTFPGCGSYIIFVRDHSCSFWRFYFCSAIFSRTYGIL